MGSSDLKCDQHGTGRLTSPKYFAVGLLCPLKLEILQYARKAKDGQVHHEERQFARWTGEELIDRTKHCPRDEQLERGRRGDWERGARGFAR